MTTRGTVRIAFAASALAIVACAKHDDATFDGGVAPTPIDVVIARARPRFKRCYADGLLAQPHMSGSVHIRVVIAPSGEVTSTQPDEAFGLSDAVEACLEGVLRATHFDPRDAGTTIEVPIRFVSER